VLDRGRHVPAFLRHSLRVRRLLRRTPGLVGYALMADVRARTFTETAAFESLEAMRDFVRQPRHAAAMAAMLPHIAPGSKIVSIDVYGRDLPPRPEAVVAALEETGGIEEVHGQPRRTVDGPRPGHATGADTRTPRVAGARPR